MYSQDTYLWNCTPELEFCVHLPSLNILWPLGFAMYTGHMLDPDHMFGLLGNAAVIIKRIGIFWYYLLVLGQFAISTPVKPCFMGILSCL